MSKRRTVAFWLIATSLLSGCASGADADAVPEGISVAVYQTRTDVGPRRLELSITNNTEGALQITGARLDSEQFVAPAVWAKDHTSIPAGATVDLPVLLPAPNCTAVAPDPVVEFDYVLADGTAGTARTIADDRIDRLPSLMVEDCIAKGVSDIVGLTITAPPRASTIAGLPVVELDLATEPTGSAESVELVSLSSTTLFMTPDPATGIPTNEQPLGIIIQGTDAPTVVTLFITPGRCDPHAIQEDKRGTIMPIDVKIGDTEGRIYVPAADSVRGALYQFVTDACS